MRHTVVCCLAVFAAGARRAAGGRSTARRQRWQGLPAVLVGVDLDKNTITFKTTRTLPLTADVKVRGENNKPETLKQFKDNMDKEDDKSIFIVEDADAKQVAAVRDLPGPDNRQHAALVGVDLDKNTITFKAKGKDGKEVETTLPLAKDIKVFGEDNKAETLKQFKDNMDKEDNKSILVAADADGKQIVTVADLPPEEIKLKAALIGLDLDKGAITFKAKGKDGKETESTLPLGKPPRCAGEDNKPETLQQFKDADGQGKRQVDLPHRGPGRQADRLAPRLAAGGETRSRRPLERGPRQGHNHVQGQGPRQQGGPRPPCRWGKTLRCSARTTSPRRSSSSRRPWTRRATSRS